MARPCGCAGECGCTYIGVDGVRITGTGTSRDPGRVGLASPITGGGCDAIFSCITARLGPGMGYTNNQLIARISGDGGNTIITGTDGGLFSSGGAAPGDTGFPTVDGLAAITTGVIGGTYGAGLSIHPEGGLKPYEAAMDMDNLPLVHVPVRRTRDFWLVAQHFGNINKYNPKYNAADPHISSISWLDLATIKKVVHLPAGTPTGDFSDPNYAPKAGYFGFQESFSTGIPMLSEVFTITQRRKVLWLEVKDTGTSTGEQTSALTFVILNGLIQKFGLSKSVIVTASLPAASSSDRQPLLDGLTLLKNAGVATGATLETAQAVNDNTPAALTALGIKWVGINYAVAAADTVKARAYKDAGLNVLLTGTHRQWHWELSRDVIKFGPGALKGCLSYDPMYTIGSPAGRYLRDQATWSWPMADYGRHSPYSDTIEGQHEKFRGYFDAAASPDNILLDSNIVVPQAGKNSAYYILMGEECPTPASNNFDIECGFAWDAPSHTADPHWIGLFVCVPTDNVLYDDQLVDGNTQGYLCAMNTAGECMFRRFDGTPGGALPWQFEQKWASGFGAAQPVTPYRFRIRIRPDRIAFGRDGQAENGPDTRTFTNALGGGDRWRGRYFYAGRQFPVAGQPDNGRVRWFFLNVNQTPVP